MVVPTGGEALTMGPEVAPLEVPQILVASPQEDTCAYTRVNPSDDTEDPSGPPGTEPTAMETNIYDMAEDVKLLLPAVAIILDKIDKVHKAMPLKEDLTHGLYVIKVEVYEVKDILTTVQSEVQANTEQPAPVREPTFIESNRHQLDRVATFNLLQAEAFSNLEHHVKDISASLNDLTSCIDNDKEMEKDKSEKITINNASYVVAVEDAIITDEAEAEDDDDVVIAPATHEDLPSTCALQDVGDDEEENENEESQILEFGQDLGDNDDDEDNDDDDITIQYHRIPAQKGVSLRELASQGERTSRNQHSSKDKGVGEEGNLALLFKAIDPMKVAQ
ncbi:uncharacterized protein LOC112503676 [Cynara cardunculus var. scolymus]|uniref:uncharacterized protein LOC112503676 n=1 Tax=Cynara cardunculus var. scolymus TaxID=59895 RepID=UPI000D630CB2|nr:uncharacterized protein LOC112503676 [Cynara cardunculus var. scolymus]